MIDWTALRPAETRAAEALAEAKSAARAEITTRVSAARSAMITTLPGQQMIYLAKEAEAARYIADCCLTHKSAGTRKTPAEGGRPRTCL